MLANLRTFLLEANLTYQARKDLVFGTNLVLGSRFTNLEKYDFGLSWEAAPSCFLGLRHDSLNKQQLSLGKFFLFFHHVASASNTLGTEFTLDYHKKVLEARFGLNHKFSEDTSAKFKVNHHGYLDTAIKHRLSNAATLGVVSGFNLKNAALDSKGKSLPLGLSFDFKF